MDHSLLKVVLKFRLLFSVFLNFLILILMLGASLLVAINAVKKGAAAEGMKVWDYIWRGHDPTSVAVMTEVFPELYAYTHCGHNMDTWNQ